ncbi:Terpene cyclase 6 [Fusarium torreyae]|uniref:Terpene cyclase 6 n=1 Tax=Fusarium torreyae TaxID=1237075 RepID=A0A9W8RLG4_9HYPO|nr:Terpene cyclase 6 [Fusarium torreyae]
MPHKNLPIRPVAYTFDPVGPDALRRPELDFSSLFGEETVSKDTPLVLYPEKMGIPWQTSLPWVRQSKFWVYAEEAGRNLVTEISLGRTSERGKLPIEMEDDRRKWKIDELVEDAISCCTYLYPTSSPIRLALLTQSVLLLFFHDGTPFSTIKLQRDHPDEITVMDEFLTMEPKNKHLQRFSREVLDINPILGPDLLQAIRAFVRDGRAKSPFKQSHYAHLSDYMLYRRNDVGKQFMIAAIRFGGSVRHTSEELAPFDELSDLYVRHSILINDLYSYDKEIHEAKAIDASIVNAVAVTEQLLSVPPHLAKNITRTITWDMEREFYTMCKKFMHDLSLNDRQRIYVTALFDALTGNIFHSATLSRYVRHAEKPLLCMTQEGI